MAHNNRERSSAQERDSWWAMGLKAAAGLGVLSASAILAAEAYKATKQREKYNAQAHHRQRQQQMAASSSAQVESCSDDGAEEEKEPYASGRRTCDWSDYEEVDSDDYEEAAAQEHANVRMLPVNSDVPSASGLPLKTRLESYYTSYVLPNEERQQSEREELKPFKTFFMKFVKQHGNNLPIQNAFFAGDRSQVTIVKAYDASTKLLVLPIEMNPHTWEYEDARHSVLKAPGYFLVRRINLDFIPKGQDPWDKFMVGNYLCPAYVLRHLQRLLGSSINEFCKMSPGEEPSVTIEAKIYAKLGPRLVTLSSSPFSPRPSGVMQDDEYDEVESMELNLRPDTNLWMWCFNEFVLEMLHELDGSDGGCRMKCLAIMEVLRVNNSKLQVLSHAHLLAIMYIACVEETEWDEQMLAERFFDILVILTRCLSNHDLPHPRDQSVNCFLDLPSWALQRIRKWLKSILKNPRKISGMLKHKY
ncbi:mitochondrial dynamics protein MID49-like [Lytechinus pictus]|uniref:mitochondrial dynamics protein MID49-like n=1 Tax=Lytechinus pictus TaxID=7653 RepID=UPI0030B9B6B4